MREGSPVTEPRPAPLRAGRPAPEIEGVDADGRTFRLSDYRGKVVLLHFWRES
jgi:peroxiredoxin